MPLRDNSTFMLKIRLRRKLILEVDEPIILESHGGMGAIYQALYSRYEKGVVLDIKKEAVEHLAAQRPTWATYQGDSERALWLGAGSHLECNYFDIDPYGEPWPTIHALFSSRRPWPDRIVFAVTDGLRGRLQMNLAWKHEHLAKYVEEFTNEGIYHNYLEVAERLMTDYAQERGYRMAQWIGYYCGTLDHISHYGVVFEKQGLS